MERVGALLRDLGGGEPLRRRLAEARALESWPDLVGPHLARKTRPLRVAGRRLLVVAHGSALRQELMFHKETILRKFNGVAGAGTARDILFLESDENLSSLLGQDKATEPVTPRSPKIGEVGESSLPERTASATPASSSPTSPRKATAEADGEWTGPVYEQFHAEAYRRELRRIAEE